MPRVTQQQRTKGGDLGVYVRLLPTVYIMPPSLPLAVPSPSRPTAHHPPTLPIAPILPTDIHSRRPSVYPSDVAGCYIIAVHRCQFSIDGMQRCHLEPVYHVGYGLPLPVCLSCLPASLPTYLPTRIWLSSR